jgi:hypothetical protein
MERLTVGKGMLHPSAVIVGETNLVAEVLTWSWEVMELSSDLSIFLREWEARYQLCLTDGTHTHI